MAGDIDDDWEDKARKRIATVAAQFPNWRRFDGLETLHGLACALEEIDALRAELADVHAVFEEERKAHEVHVAALRAKLKNLRHDREMFLEMRQRLQAQLAETSKVLEEERAERDSAAAARAAAESRAEELLGPRKYADPPEADQDPPLPEEEPAPRKSTPEWHAKFDPSVCQRRSDCLGLRPSSVCWGTGRCQRLERWQP